MLRGQNRPAPAFQRVSVKEGGVRPRRDAGAARGAPAAKWPAYSVRRGLICLSLSLNDVLLLPVAVWRTLTATNRSCTRASGHENVESSVESRGSDAAGARESRRERVGNRVCEN